MLELMMKQPEGFENTWDSYFEGDTWKHKKSSTCFTKSTNWSGDIEYYYINLCSITNEEGEYLQQGVSFIEAYKKSVKESANKKHRHEVDLKIREVLEGL
jgi:hypothetical protein